MRRSTRKTDADSSSHILPSSEGSRERRRDPMDIEELPAKNQLKEGDSVLRLMSAGPNRMVPDYSRRGILDSFDKFYDEGRDEWRTVALVWWQNCSRGLWKVWRAQGNGEDVADYVDPQAVWFLSEDVPYNFLQSALSPSPDAVSVDLLVRWTPP
jgi:hypothetical protein